jgi:phage shock protein A
MSDEVIRRMNEGFSLLTQQMNARFEQVEARMDARFEQVDKRFEQVDARFEQVDRRFEQIDARFTQVETRMADGFAQVETRFVRVEGRLEQVEKLTDSQGVLLERCTDDIRFLAEKIGTIEGSVERKLTEFGQMLDHRLVPLEQTVKEHSRLLEGRQ